MQYISKYNSPIGNIILSADETGLTGLDFDIEKKFISCSVGERKDNPVLAKTEEWLDIYFSGKEPNFKLPMHLIGTDFQREVWAILCSIPYGKTVTYGEIAEIIAKKRGIKRMSAQAVGGAVGSNKIAIIVPCHRVLGAHGALTGYAGGMDKKIALLRLENIIA